jgi:hypothetical protein
MEGRYGRPKRALLTGPTDDASRALLLAAGRAETTRPFNIGTGLKQNENLAASIAEAAGFEGEVIRDSNRELSRGDRPGGRPGPIGLTVSRPARRACALAAFALAAWIAIAAPAASAMTLRTGFFGPELVSPQQGTRELWAGRVAGTGASLERIDVSWRAVAPPKRPAGFDPKDPASPGYYWTELDAAVRSAAAHGLQVMFDVLSAPEWAEGAGRPANVTPGTWKPRAGAFGDFAQALAARYSGSFPDPLVPGSSIPRVRYFEVWNEPNLKIYLNPQWEGNRETGAAIYRELVNRFYTGVKAVQPDSEVIAGSLAPWGQGRASGFAHPIEFLRSMLCLRGSSLRPLPCPEPAHFDVLSAHPINIGAPTRSAVNPLDVSPPDLGRVTTVLNRAEQTGRALPGGRKPLWVTEFWTDSSPPDPDGVPVYEQARWYEQDLYLFWKQGAQAAIALQIRDAPPGPGYKYTSQAGVYFLNGKPKPSLTAMRFPFVVTQRSSGSAGVWGMAPQSGRLQVQAQIAGHWATIASRSVAARAVFSFSAPVAQGPVKLRAVVGAEASLPWALG